MAGMRSLINELVAAIRESMGAQRLPGSGTYAFRKMTEPLLLDIKATATRYDVPPGFFDQGGPGFQATSWWVVNPNNCYVRLKGTTSGAHVPVTDSTGWLFPPNFSGPFSTQYPTSMSTLAVVRGGLPIPAKCDPLEIIYGGGN